MLSRESGRWLLYVVATLLLAALAAALAAHLAERRVLASLTGQVATDARLRAALLDSELTRFRLLPAALADDRDVAAAREPARPPGGVLDRKLEGLARITGAPVIYVMRPDGVAIASSNWRSPRSFVGPNYSFRPYFREALERGDAAQFALGTVSRLPGLYIARRAANRRVITIKLDFRRIEAEWASAGGITYVRDALGVVLVTSRPQWRFYASRPLTPADELRYRAETRVPSRALSPLPVEWLAGNRRALVSGVEHVVQDVPTSQPGWRLSVLRATEPTVAPARRAAGLGAALTVIAIAAITWTLLQRASIARLRTAGLEQAVAERTADLRREMDERTGIEAKAAELREGLRQANRLATLGQVTASFAHETAQPVAAIRTYVESTELLLERGNLAEVRSNLGAIARLADRIGTIAEELRGFSRRQPGGHRPVRVATLIDGARLILKDQLRTVQLDVSPFDPELKVIGGRVRLEQVLVNLVQNALEALTGRADPRLAIVVEADAERVRLTVADNGPGISEDMAARLFTPFATSRPNGLGLGLVIAQDIMVELGGSLRLAPSAQGASFQIEMPRA